MIKIKDKKLNRVQMILAIISFPLGIFITVFLYYYPSYSQENIDDYLFGIWHSKYSFKIKEGEYSIEGTTEYFKNHSYNFVGQVIINATINNEVLLITYNLDGTGTWSSDSNSFLTTMIDMKSFPISAKYNGHEIDISIFEKNTGKDAPNLDNTMPKGTNEEFKVISLGKDEILAEVDDLQGSPIRFKMTKQAKRFQR